MGANTRGFTLIELSIVLVIIGLIVGGVLVGQDLIRAAGVRATIAQIEKYNTAVNTFRGKYGALPGDMSGVLATQFGFAPRGQYAGEGDGNGVIEGVTSDAAGQNGGALENIGETTTFWVDLSQAGLIDGSFNSASETVSVPNWWAVSGDLVLPQAKLGGGNYVYVWSGGWGLGAEPPAGSNGINYFGILGGFNGLDGTGQTYWTVGMTVRQAYEMDNKVDDGLPQSGNVTAMFIYNGGVGWAAATGTAGGNTSWPSNGPTTAATPWAATNCYDNNGVIGPQTYSLSQNSNQVNCALSFQFQ